MVGMSTLPSTSVAQQSCDQGTMLQKCRKSIHTYTDEVCSWWTARGSRNSKDLCMHHPGTW